MKRPAPCAAGLARRPLPGTHFLTADEEARVRSAIAERHWPIVAIALHTGLRQGEQLVLRWEDVDFATGLILVTRSKSGEPRRVPMKPVVATML